MSIEVARVSKVFWRCVAILTFFYFISFFIQIWKTGYKRFNNNKRVGTPNITAQTKMTVQTNR